MYRILFFLAIPLLLATGTVARAETTNPLVRILYTANGFGYFHPCPT